MDELEATEMAAEAAAREARKTLHEQHKAEATANLDERVGKLKEKLHVRDHRACPSPALSPATGSVDRWTPGRKQVMQTALDEAPMAATEPISRTTETRRTELEVSLSIKTILLVAGVVAVAWALASIASVLLVIFVSTFSVAVLSPVVTAMERRLHWSRRLSAVGARRGDSRSSIGALMLVVVQAVVGRGARLQRRPATNRRGGQTQRSG